jgi:hypothetical protein
MKYLVGANIRKFIKPAIWAVIIGGAVWVYIATMQSDPDADKTWTLVIISNGVAVVSGYANMAACAAAGRQLREQVGEASQPITACIVAGSKDPYR